MRAIKTTTISILALGLLSGSAVGAAAQDEVAADMPTGPATFSGTYEGSWPPVVELTETIVDGVEQYRDEVLAGSIETTDAVVEPYADRTYKVAAHQPTRYRSTGRIETMVCSWYGNEFNGRPTASGQIFNEEDLTCASRTLPFGTRIALSRGDLRIIVVVTDRIAREPVEYSHHGPAVALTRQGVEHLDIPSLARPGLNERLAE